jgi:hypothetical protein
MSKISVTEHLAELDARQRAAQRERRAAAPMVGIFWFIPVDGKPKIVADGTTLREAEEYGDLKTHSRDHLTMWEALKDHLGSDVAGTEYDT